MKFPFKTLILAFSLATLVLSCDTQDKNAKGRKPLNPNGDSELALLMRAMTEEAELMKAQIEKGEKLEVTVDYNEILTAKATEPEKKEAPEYAVFADAHIQSMEILANADTSRIVSLYGNMINNCINCHKELCPGPLPRIEKLKVASK